MPPLDQTRRILIVAGGRRAGGIRCIGRLTDSATADAVWRALPLTGPAQRWGEEVYLSTPLRLDVSPGARQVVEPGTLAFWCAASIIVVPLGPTPISLREECRLVGPANLWGRLEAGGRGLARIVPGMTLTLRRLER